MTSDRMPMDSDDLRSAELRGNLDPLPMDGAEVITADGDKIGTVREVQGSYFKVDAAMMPDYWLPVSDVSSSGGGAIVLNFTKDVLDDYKVDRPEAA